MDDTNDTPKQSNTRVVRRSWPQAFLLYLKDTRASLFFKFALFGGSATVLDDIIPGIGLIDEPLVPVWMIVVIYVFFQVRKYR